MKCPKCGLINPDTALRCDCSYDFAFYNPNLKLPKKVSKGFFTGSIIAGAVLGSISLLSFAPLFLLLLLYLSVVRLVFVYKIWASIQDGQARTTPLKAAVLLIIPIFNIYWTFQAFWGFAKDYNKFVGRHSVTVGRLSEGIILTYAIVMPIALSIFYIGPITVIAIALESGPLLHEQLVGLLDFLSYVQLILGIFISFADLLVTSYLCDAVNDLADAYPTNAG